MSLVTRLEPLAKQRLFAIIHMFGKQHLITTGDLLSIDHHIPLECGQKLLFNKCLVLGGKDFSIIGRPILDKEIFKVDATVIEKTMTDIRCKYWHKPRNRGIQKFLYQTHPRTVFRINNIELKKLPD